ncbi:Mitochondrial transcription termination factor, mTERF [Handroanthus impetiginosus]|uniref:Mitochondrial transcription termination factor, mTERF n=1 Tax=Handroanthus impetiginosus TaxID=429701 RepID=A0A2G9GCK8_9LAMI|nr:Mitochondrial transcription termination factor, mTERF [Handroanthus impetiginosus]
MRKFKLAPRFHSPFFCHCDPRERLFVFVCSLFSVSHNRAYTSTPHLSSENIVLVDYLTDTLKLPKTKAITISSRYPYINSLAKPKAVISFFKSLGFSDAQVQFSALRQPAVLFSDVEKTLKPKVKFFQELGIAGPHLGELISKNPALLTGSLDKKLKPSIGVIKKVVELDGRENSKAGVNDLVFRILSRYSWVLGKNSRLSSSINYLRSCGVVGSQLIMLLRSEPRLFSLPEAELKILVSRATQMGCSIGSRMLVYGISVHFSNSAETINRKYELLQSFGFSKGECDEMFVKSPYLFKTSEAKLRRGIGFFLNTLMLDKSVILRSPCFLKFSMEKRMIPRYKILEMIKSRKLLKKGPSFLVMLVLPEEKFVERYILRFADDAEEMLAAYYSHLSGSSKGTAIR